jgi:hypothetical protein
LFSWLRFAQCDQGELGSVLAALTVLTVTELLHGGLDRNDPR